MRKRELGMFVMMALGLLMLAVSPHVGYCAADNSGYVNVKDFGAKGDNVTDDTRAIQAAFDANTTGEVVFPAGSYRLSDAIKINGGTVSGHGGVGITQDNPKKDIFYTDGACWMTIRGLTFNGGVNQLNLGNNNMDTGLVIIEKCHFLKSTGIAVQMRQGSNSTHLIVKDCRFLMCDQTLVSHTDWTTLRDSWITTGFMKNKAAIENRGAKMMCDSIVGVPLVTGSDDRWIDNYGSITCRNFRFGGEFGGFTPVVHYSKLSGSVILEDCAIYGLGNKKRTCVIYCEEIPATISIRDSYIMGIPPIQLSPAIDLATYFDYVAPDAVAYEFSGTTGEFLRDLPKGFLNAVKNRKTGAPPIPGQLTAQATKKALALAVDAVKSMKSQPKGPQESEGHAQKTDPRDYVEIGFDKAKWDTGDLLDGMKVKNSEYIAVAPAGEDIVILHRAKPLWPHVLIRDVAIDLDRTPFLSWQLKNSGMPNGYAVKVIHKESQKMLVLGEINSGPFDSYQARDLRKLLDLKGGRHTFDIRFYAIGQEYRGVGNQPVAKPGEYQIIDFIRTEAE